MVVCQAAIDKVDCWLTVSKQACNMSDSFICLVVCIFYILCITQKHF
jgi:hypothetical protein